MAAADWLTSDAVTAALAKIKKENEQEEKGERAVVYLAWIESRDESPMLDLFSSENDAVDFIEGWVCTDKYPRCEWRCAEFVSLNTVDEEERVVGGYVIRTIAR